MTEVTAPETALRERLIEVFNEEFETEGVVFGDDKIHDSLGQTGPVGGVYPSTAAEGFEQGLLQDTIVIVQLFNRWDREIDPKQAVSPGVIEEWAERLRRACRADELGTPGDEHLWYYRVLRIEYPPDPSGNITRLLATVQASSQNAGLTETSG